MSRCSRRSCSAGGGLLAQHAQADIATLATPIDSLADFLDPNVVKLVTDLRAARPVFQPRADSLDARWGAGGPGQPDPWHGARRHRGVVRLSRGALSRMAALPPSALELGEKLEQLRALEAGFDIRVADCAVQPGPDVNTAEDYARVSALFAASQHS